MSASIAAYTDGIVNTKGVSDPLELPELQAVVGILTALPPSPLPGSNALYQRVRATLTGPTNGSADGIAAAQTQAAVHVCLCLAMEPSNRDTVLGVVEAAQSRLDAAVAASSTSPLACDVLLLMTLCTNFALECRQALELFEQRVEALVQAVALSVSIAAGTNPGVSSLFKGAVQAQAIANLVSLLRELTSWKMYDYITFQRHAEAPGATQAGPGNNVDMHRLAGPFKGYVGTICRLIAQTNMYSSLGRYYEATLFCQAASEQADVAWEVLVLTENLLTLTNVFAVQLRKHLLGSGVLSTFLAPYVIRQLLGLTAASGNQRTDACHDTDAVYEAVSLITLCARVLATMTFSIGGYQAYWRADQALPAALTTATHTLLSPCEAATGGGTLVQSLSGRARVELVSQLVRLVVNGHIERAVDPLRALWPAALSDEKERGALARQLSDPMRRRQPLDVRSPVYASLREIFTVTGRLADEGVRAAPLFNTADGADWETSYDADDDDADDDVDDDVQVRGASRRQSRRRGRGGLGHGRGDARHTRRGKDKRRQREQQRERRRQRYVFLCSIRDRPAGGSGGDGGGSHGGPEAVSVEEERLAQLSSDEDEEAAADVLGTASAGTAQDARGAGGVDLSRWRKGPPPVGVPRRYICALSQRIIVSAPALSPHGYVFDHDVIVDYLTTYAVCPISGEPLYRQDLIVDKDLAEELARVRFNFINAL